MFELISRVTITISIKTIHFESITNVYHKKLLKVKFKIVDLFK